MKDKLEKLQEVSGDHNRYQYFVLIISSLIWAFLEVTNVSVPFLEIMPIVNYYDQSTHQNITTELTHQICTESNFTINTSLSKNSWHNLLSNSLNAAHG